MNKTYTKLDSVNLEQNNAFIKPPELPELVHMHDPAVDVMEDFQYQRAATINAEASLDDALMEMKASNVHLLLVTNDNNNVVGIISSQVIQGEKPYKIMEDRRIKHSEITVKMMMRNYDSILCVEFETLQHAKVGSIVQTLKCAKRQYILVIENTDSGEQLIHGYVSASQISKKLGEDITGNLGFANSVAELQQVLKDFD